MFLLCSFVDFIFVSSVYKLLKFFLSHSVSVFLYFFSLCRVDTKVAKKTWGSKAKAKAKAKHVSKALVIESHMEIAKNKILGKYLIFLY
jgi:hypothetical protein